MKKNSRLTSSTPNSVRVILLLSHREENNYLISDMHHRFGVIPVGALGDPRSHLFLLEQFHDIQLLDYRSLLASSGELVVCSTQEAQTLSNFLNSSLFREVEPILLGEFNREPTLDVARGLDQQAKLRVILSQVVRLFAQTDPDFLFASETPHNVVDLSAFYFAKWTGLPTLFFQPTSTIGPNLLPRVNLDEPMRLEGLGEGQNFPTILSLREEFANSALESFLNNRNPVRMEAEIERNAKEPSRTKSRRVFLLRRLRATLTLLSRFMREGEWRDTLNGLLFGTFHTRFLSEVNSLSTEPVIASNFAFFPLHYQPERTSVPEGGNAAHQMDYVLQARSLLSHDWNLVVKEHPSQVSKNRSGFLGRSTHSYELLRSIEGIQLVGPGWEVNSHLHRIKLCFTLTGSLGIQAALRGVPVVYFGNPWWEGLPGTYRYRDDLSISDVLLDSGRHGKVEKVSFLLHLVRSGTIPGFGSPSQESFWRRHLKLSDDFGAAELQSKLEVIKQFLVRHNLLTVKI